MINTRKYNTPPSLGQWASATSLLALAVAGSTTSLYLNWTFGWEIGVVPAVGFAIADIGYFLLSVMKRQLAGRAVARQIGRAVFMAMSLIAASSHLTQEFEQRQHAVEAIAAKVATAKRNEAEARATLADIKEIGDAAAMQSEADAYTARVAVETGQGGCLKKCKEAGDKAASLLPRIGAARQRDKLKNRLDSAAQIVADTPERAFGGTATYARITGISEAQFAAYSYLVIMAMVIAALLIASAFSGAAAEDMADCIARRKAARASLEVRIAPRGTGAILPVPTTVDLPAAPEAFSTSQPVSVEDEMLLTVQMMILHAPEQRMRISIRELAKRLQVARATLQDWTQRWRDEGKIAYRTVGNETVFTSPMRIAA